MAGTCITHTVLHETALMVLAFIEPIAECLGRFTVDEWEDGPVKRTSRAAKEQNEFQSLVK